MRVIRGLMATGLVGMLTMAGIARAETKVELKGVHLCCGGCVKGVASALKGVEGVTPRCDREARTITITARDDKGAQEALDALAAAGYHGETGNPALLIKDEPVPKGRTKSVTVSGIHNCCRSCCKAIKDAVKTVDGVKGETAQPKASTFEVTGDFNAADVVKALNAAGFHAKVKD